MALMAALAPLLFFSASTAQQNTYTVTGTIKTPLGSNAQANDVIVKHIKVIVMDDNFVDDQALGSGHTDANGNFSIQFAAPTGTFVESNVAPDIYINVEYVGTAVDNKFILVRDEGTLDFFLTQIDEDIENNVHQNQAPGTLNLGTLRVKSTTANLVTQVGDAARYLKTQVPTWTMPSDVKVVAKDDGAASEVTGVFSTFLNIGKGDYDNPGTGSAAFSDLHHEFFHWVASRAYGSRWPDPNCRLSFVFSAHGDDVESCQGFAMQEGSAQYFGDVSSRSYGINDNKNSDPNSFDWKGEDFMGGEQQRRNCGRRPKLDLEKPHERYSRRPESPGLRFARQHDRVSRRLLHPQGGIFPVDDDFSRQCCF